MVSVQTTRLAKEHVKLPLFNAVLQSIKLSGSSDLWLVCIAPTEELWKIIFRYKVANLSHYLRPQ